MQRVSECVGDLGVATIHFYVGGVEARDKKNGTVNYIIEEKTGLKQ